MFRQIRRNLFIPVATFFLFLTAGVGYAQDEAAELITDRPDQTESAAVVPKGSVQLEVGALFVHDDEGGLDLDVVEVPGTLVRVGLHESLELRIGWVGHISVDEGAEGLFDDSGIGDAELGIKYRFADENGARPEMAVLVSTSVPVGDDGFTTDEFDPSIRLSLAHTLSERLSLGYNLGVGLESVPDGFGGTTTLSTYFYTIALGIGLSDRVGAFVELFGDVPGSAPGGAATSFDGGFTFLVRDHVQLDVAGGVGLSDAAPDWFVGVGVSARFPR